MSSELGEPPKGTSLSSCGSRVWSCEPLHPLKADNEMGPTPQFIRHFHAQGLAEPSADGETPILQTRKLRLAVTPPVSGDTACLVPEVAARREPLSSGLRAPGPVPPPPPQTALTAQMNWGKGSPAVCPELETSWAGPTTPQPSWGRRKLSPMCSGTRLDPPHLKRPGQGP